MTNEERMFELAESGVKFLGRLWWLSLLGAFGIAVFFTTTQLGLSELRSDVSEIKVKILENIEERVRALESTSTAPLTNQAQIDKLEGRVQRLEAKHSR